MIQKISPAVWKALGIALLCVLLAPFLINCFYAYPQTDDFMYAVIARDMGFIKSQHHWYVSWTGRYTSTALLSVNPLVYNSLLGYRLLFAIFIMMLLTAIYALSAVITKRTLSWQENLLFSLTLLFAFFDQMDDIRSGLYWMAGVATYQVATTLFFFFMALYLRTAQAYPMPLQKIALILLALLLGGTNEVLMVLLAAFVTIHCINVYVRKKAVTPFQIITCCTAVAASSCGLLAPGNFVRLKEHADRQGLVMFIWNVLHRVMTDIGAWVTSPLILILTAMVFWGIRSKPQLRLLLSGFKVGYALSMQLIITFVSFFIPYWSTGMAPQNRVLNMIYVLFLVGWMVNLAIIFTHYEKIISLVVQKIPGSTGCVVIILYLVGLFALGTSNFMTVAKDLCSGDSSRYSAEMQAREAQLVNSAQENCTLDNISTAPRSLFFFFIGYDKDNWVNHWYAKYFGKSSITLVTNNARLK